MNRMKRTWVSLFLVVMLIVLAGCQAVNGLDVSKMFANSLNIQSAQGTQTLTLELEMNPSVTPMTDEQLLLELFSKVSVRISEFSMQDWTHASLKGVFEYTQGQIPFQMSMSDMETVIALEGAKKPIVMHNQFAGMETMKETITPEMERQFNEFYKKTIEFMPAFYSYLIGNAPNPANITAGSNKFRIQNQNEGVNGKKVHIEIKGSEWIGLAKGLLTNLVADEKGMKDMLGQLYDVYIPLVKQYMQEKGPDGDSSMDMMSLYLNNKSLAVETAFAFLNSHLKQMLDESSSAMDMPKLLTDDAFSLKMDVYTDSELTPRKTDTEIVIASPTENSAVKSIKLTSASEWWNVNKPVTANKIDTSAGSFVFAPDKPARIVSILDPNSQLYKLLKKDLKITRKDIRMSMDSGSGDSTAPYNLDGTVMVPIRYVVEQLDADVAWEPSTQKITVTDPLNGIAVNLNVGSQQASVNGMIKPLEKAAEIRNESTYVPLRFIAESMGAKVGWDQESQTVTISRD
ncbi:copper amine oxidase N-terminal domain-containing protein [Paenibacillus piri]|uniref:Copper amine oxidase N-terminal domain-containing protein n=1 Tax=Paenibacillus piri TaxID=2547395 RepID=A0A4R5KSP5_9BACL|nr:copper amine oxidase N-terminal domain-containing protein [Paenibacillus piri]TDF98893.1 copper amine oxidase N-terminal domain-containing protein [Paenibacillus piri]